MSGRSRGRARTAPQMPGAAATPGTVPPPENLEPQAPPPQQAAAATTSQISPPPTSGQASPPTPPRPAARVSSPQRPAIPPVSESAIGRGRGISTLSDVGSTATTSIKSPSVSGTASTLALPGASSSSGSGSRSGNGNVSPGAASSEESPPQQHSPPVIGTGAVGVGRAAIRGAPHQSKLLFLSFSDS